MRHDLSSCRYPEAILVFEYKLQSLLYEHQIQGLNDMLGNSANGALLQLPDVFLQRIQGGGKTLVFGHLMALCKADGFHLSLHVSPDHQYATNLPQMGKQSQDFFAQQEHSLQFDDHPQHFTSEYLQHTFELLKRAIVNRDYINTTSQTLRALRCKWIKTNLNCYNNDELPDEERQNQLSKNYILQHILTLLRQRAVFTFDEVHQAMDPRKELNMPYGENSYFNPIQTELIGAIVRLAADYVELRLPENKQAQEIERCRTDLLKFISEQLLGIPLWRNRLELSTETDAKDAALSEFLLKHNAPLPEFLEETRKTQNAGELCAADHAILAQQMLAGDWLTEALCKSVNEHFGIVHDHPDALPIAIPFTANMKPAIGSEFSDRFVTMTHTFIAYIIDGVVYNQIKDFIQYVRKKAAREVDEKQKTDSEFTLQKTKAFTDFTEFCNGMQSVGNTNLFTIDTANKTVLQDIQDKLNSGDALARQLLVDYVGGGILARVPLYDQQVTSQGQNTASMAKTVNGYSGSIDNMAMAPVMTASGRRTVLQPEEGTNGQTIDLLLSRNSEVWVIESQPESLFTQLLDNHSEREHIRAIIDIGCQFRGQGNDDVAAQICTWIKKKKENSIQGVLFFDPITDKLRYLHKNNTDSILISGTKTETINAETNTSPNERFTYYDQNHITGTDIEQADTAIAICTCSENTLLHNVLQGVRRMRKLDQNQRVITAVQMGSLTKMGRELGVSEAFSEISLGQCTKKDFIKEIILFIHLNETHAQIKDNLQFALQKMTNLIRQYLLDQVYSLQLHPAYLFSGCPQLFVNTVALDLYQEFGRPHTALDIDTYLTKMRNQLLDTIKRLNPNAIPGFKPSPADIAQLEQRLSEIINEAQKHGLEESIDVRADFEENDFFNAGPSNREGTMVQMRQQENQSIQERRQQNENVTTYTGPQRMPCKRRDLTENIFFDVGFGRSDCSANDQFPVDAIARLLPPHLEPLVDPDIFVAEKFSITLVDEKKIYGTVHKPLLHVLLICDQSEETTAKNEWTLLWLSTEDAEQCAIYMNGEKSLPKGRSVFLFRPQGIILQAMPKKALTDVDRILKLPNIQTLFLQSLCFSGNRFFLEQVLWKSHYQSWLQKLGAGGPRLSEFLEESVFPQRHKRTSTRGRKSFTSKFFSPMANTRFAGTQSIDYSRWDSYSSPAPSMPPIDGVCGIVNEVNTCYMNATMQLILHTPILKSLQVEPIIEKHTSTLTQWIKKYQGEKTSAVSGIRSVITNTNADWGYAQQDAHEALLRLLGRHTHGSIDINFNVSRFERYAVECESKNLEINREEAQVSEGIQPLNMESSLQSEIIEIIKQIFEDQTVIQAKLCYELADCEQGYNHSLLILLEISEEEKEEQRQKCTEFNTHFKVQKETLFNLHNFHFTIGIEADFTKIDAKYNSQRREEIEGVFSLPVPETDQTFDELFPVFFNEGNRSTNETKRWVIGESGIEKRLIDREFTQMIEPPPLLVVRLKRFRYEEKSQQDIVKEIIFKDPKLEETLAMEESLDKKISEPTLRKYMCEKQIDWIRCRKIKNEFKIENDIITIPETCFQNSDKGA